MTDKRSSIDEKLEEESSSETKELTRKLQIMFESSVEKYRCLARTTKNIDPKSEGVTQQTIDRIRNESTSRPQNITIDLLNEAIMQVSRPGYETRDLNGQDIIAQRNRALVQRFAGAPSEFEVNAENVCILFADLVGSTEFKYHHGGIEGMAKVLTHNRYVETAIEKGGGITVKYMGDAVLGYFPGPDAARDGISAGLDLLRRIKEENKEGGWQYPDPKEICTRVGVHFGPAWMFPFKQLDRLDPQGPTVDLAARLCGVAGPMQVAVTEKTFIAAGGDDTFPYHSDAEERYVQGFRERKRLLAVASDKKSVKPIPSPGYIVPLDMETQKALEHAAVPWVDNRDFEESIFRYRQLREQDPRNFVAAYRIAELLVIHYQGKPAGERERLAEASTALRDAKYVRPHCCYVWKLLSWIRYREFLLNTSDEGTLGEAVTYAETALSKAELDMDEFGSAIAKIYLIIFLNKRIEYEYGNKDSDLALAQRYVSEVQETFDKSGWVESNFYVGQALTNIAFGNPEEAIKLLDKALEANKRNPLVYEARQRLTALL